MKRDDSVGVIMEKMGRIRKMVNSDYGDERLRLL